jgi:hypothetical protein
MRWSSLGAWAVCGFGLAGCGGAASYDRAEYTAGSVASLLFSNSLVITREVRPRKLPGGGIKVDYALLFQNEGAEPARLGLAEVTAKLNDQPERVVVTCGQHGYLPSRSLDLPAGQRLRIDCRLTLTSAGVREARASDSEIVFAIPILSAGRLVEPSFAFRLKREDLS